MNSNVTVIICAYNEEKTIKGIISEVYYSDTSHELIIINDGSTDHTGKLIDSFACLDGVDIKHLPANKGKGYAMAEGALMAKGKYLVFIDADISNFSQKHAKQLLTPIVEGSADMVVGQPGRTIVSYYLNPFKKLAGQRAICKKDILPVIEKMKASRYGVETLLNIHYKKNNKRVKHIMLKNLYHLTKFQKTSPLKALKEFILEGVQIIQTIFINSRMVRTLEKTILSNN